jgi:hypothetical protein
VSAEQAASHPIPGAHSIWGLLLHVASDYTLILRGLAGHGHEVSPEEDWSPCPPPTSANVQHDVEELLRLNRQLRERVRTFPAERLDGPLVPGVAYAAYTRFIGVTQHNL